MILHFFKIAARVLLRNKLYTFINVLGLSLGIACCILILLFVRSELTYDSFHTNAESIVRVLQVNTKVDNMTEYSAFVPTPLAPAMRSEYPEILHAARMSTGGVVVTHGESSFEEAILYTDPDIFAMFDFRFLAGSGASALGNPNSIVLTRPMAEKYFGAQDPIGKQILIRDRRSEAPFVVTAVVEAMPANSSIEFDFLANITQGPNYEQLRNAWTWSNGSAYLQLAPGTIPSLLEKKLGPFILAHFATDVQERQRAGVLSKNSDAFRLELQPLTSIHLDTKVESSPEEGGNPAYSWILAGIAVLVITIACINFVTLAIGRSANRAREVGMRKVLGAFRTQLMGQFWGEAFLLAIIAMVIGIVFAELFLPTFCLVTGKALVLSLGDLGLVGSLLGLLFVVSVAAGSYPSLVLSRFEPVEVLKGRSRIGGRNMFTKLLVVLQFGISIFLVCGAIVLREQIQFMVTSNLGFHPQQVAVLRTFAGGAKSEAIAERLRSRVVQNPNILSVSATSGAFAHGENVNAFKFNGERRDVFVYRVDSEYLKTLQIPLMDGRNFMAENAEDRDHGMIVNEAFLRSIGWSGPAAGKHIPGLEGGVVENMNIVGVTKDFHFGSFREEIGPAVMFMKKGMSLNDVLFRIAPSRIPETVDYLRSVWREISPNTPFQLTFMDEDFQKLYESEMKWVRIMTYSTLFAVFLASLGLFGLATLAVTNRTKEIGVRKVLGASATGMARLFSLDFLKLVLAANVIAWPVAYFASLKYLENYAYRISLSPWLFLISGLGAMVIACLAIVGQVLRAVRANPVEALRYE